MGNPLFSNSNPQEEEQNPNVSRTSILSKGENQWITKAVQIKIEFLLGGNQHYEKKWKWNSKI